MLKRILKGIFAVFCFVAVLTGAGYAYLLTSLQTYDQTLVVNGITDKIDIVRDRNAVPHIYGTQDTDVFFALGFVHAQDRLWQMETQRRIAQGRLAEILGAAALPIDTFIRTLGIYAHAQTTYETMDADTRAVLDAYVAGVNQSLASWSGPLPPEFLILGHKPEPWVAADSLAWLTMMSLNLSKNWRTEVMRARLLTKLPPDKVQDLYPPYTGDIARPLPTDLAEHFSAFYKDISLDALSTVAGLEDARSNGSNNWVISGKLSATGKPLLANDPHLGMTIPSVWYSAQLTSQDMTVYGVSLPGVPAIILGRTQSTAWAFTNTGPDSQDLYIEKINPDNPEQYLTPDGWTDFKTREEVIKVDGADPVTLVIRTTRHGPVVSDAHEDMASVAQEGHVLALRWAALEGENTNLKSALNVMKAQTVFDIDSALKDFVAPMQSILFADINGNIGWRAPGRIPKRHPDNLAMGRLPVPGWDPIYDWTGYIPFEELPGEINPPSGMIVTANHKVVTDTYPHFLTSEWSEPYRANRIETLLKQRPTHSFSSFSRIQMDTKSGWAEEFLPFLRSTPAGSDMADQALSLLTGWDAQMSEDAPQPLIFMAWYREFVRQVLADELDDIFDDFWGYHPRFMRRVINGTAAEWCDDVGTDTTVETCLDQSVQALDRAIEDISRIQGSDISNWSWGAAHVVKHEHRPFSRVPVLSLLFERKQSAGGGPFTVQQTRNRLKNINNPFGYVHGPGFRAIYDLADLDSSGYIYSTGQSGNPLSSHYFDLSERWLNGDFLTMTGSVSDITAGMRGSTTLSPN